jgi:hypothetical protein
VLFYLLGRACVGNARRLKVLYDVDDVLDPLRSSISVLGTISYREPANDWCGIVPNASENARNQETSASLTLSHGQSQHVSSAIRQRVLQAAFTLFRENGFSSTSMLS